MTAAEALSLVGLTMSAPLAGFTVRATPIRRPKLIDERDDLVQTACWKQGSHDWQPLRSVQQWQIRE
jgi:hypothetical protein